MKHSRAILGIFALLHVAGLGECAYLVVSSPTEKALYYTRLTSAEEAARGKKLAKHALLRDGLEKPMGIAIDSLRRVLYIADPGASAVLAAHIYEHSFPSNHLTVGTPYPVMMDITAHWVAVDALGTLFCSDNDNGHIWSLSALTVMDRLNGVEGARPPTRVYSADNSDPINRPQGLAADGFHLFWANGQPGQGTVLRGLAEPHGLGSSQGDVSQLADNVDAAFGVCLSSSRVFYTAKTNSIYSLRQGGSVPTLITERLREPRGCAFDGDGTIFVADAQVGSVYAFSSYSPSLGRNQLVKALDAPGAYGLAVLVSHAPRLAQAWLWLVAAASLIVAGPCSANM